MLCKGRILVIDDDPRTADMLTRRLGGDGYDVSLARCGVECLSMLRRDDPDLVVLELGTPACDGYLTLERLRDNPHWKNLPIVVVAETVAESARVRSLRLGATAFFQKEAGAEEMLEAISRLVEESVSSAA